MKRILPILLIAAVVFGGGYYWWNARVEAANAQRIQFSGNMELTQADLSFKVAGRMVELNVREGDMVKKGQVIARIDAIQAEQTKQGDVANLGVAKSNLTQSKTSIALQQATVESDIQLKQADIRAAQARLDLLLAGSRPQEIQQASAATADAAAQLEQAKLDWERGQKLFANEDISRAQYDQYRTRYQSAQMIHKQAQEHYALVEEGPRKEDIEDARAQLQRAQAALKMSEANRLEVKRRQEDLQAKEEDIRRATAQVGISESQLDDRTLVAPMDGVVLVKAAELGEVVAAGATVVSVGDLAHPWVRGYIGEKDLDRIALGQKASITTDSGKSYVGRVSFIASEAEFTPKQIQTKDERQKLVYRVKVDADNDKLELKNNMPVDTVIALNSGK
ncbi:MAG TPA: HlyD family efflux transporter periplasmic adaptor subunit [Bryobacteraceae bacterium]|jgi:HlyD family secretion protein